MIKLHSNVCPNFQVNEVQTSLDGVTEAKSSTVSLDVYSTKFRDCRYIYPHRLVRPIKKEFVDNRELLKKVLSDYSDNGVTITNIVADNLKRATMKDCLNHSALFPCEYCFAKETRITAKKFLAQNQSKTEHTKKTIIDKIKTIEKEEPSEKRENTLNVLKNIVLELETNETSKTRQITVWPASTMNQELRTKEKVMDIVRLIHENELNEEADPLTKDQVKGVVGHSPLLDLENFDFVNNVPTEYMHLGCLGVVKRLTELTFNVGLNRPRITKRKLSSTKLFNELMALTKVVFEFSRRSRDLDFAVFKAEEFRNLILFFFPHVLACLEKNDKERAIWLYLAFMLRSCVLPDNEYFNVNVQQIVSACTKFYKMYEQTFGQANCSYSIHVLCCHLLQIRQLGPLTETSAFKFESFYGEMRNCFTPGTPSTLKQIFENVLLKRALCPHYCEKSPHITNYDTSMQCNSLVYTYINDKVNMYKVTDINDKVLICNPQGKFFSEFPETPELNWSSVGVFTKGARSTESVKVDPKLIAGKVLQVGSFLITCPNNVLKEK